MVSIIKLSLTLESLMLSTLCQSLLLCEVEGNSMDPQIPMWDPGFWCGQGMMML